MELEACLEDLSVLLEEENVDDEVIELVLQIVISSWPN